MQKDERTKSPDLKISYLNRDSWQIAPVSLRARGWLAKRAYDGPDSVAGRVKTNLREVNRLAASARTDGLIIEFNGPHETFHL